MNRWVLALLGGALALSVGIPVTSAVVASSVDPAAAASLDEDQNQPEVDAAAGGEAEGHGPPPWAQGHHAKAKEKVKHHGMEKDLAAWKAMTPAQRKATMAELVRQHTQGMKEFSACVAAGEESCVKPLPPGLAKRG